MSVITFGTLYICKLRFLLFSFAIFSSVFASIEMIYKTLQTVLEIFPNTSMFVKNTPLCDVFPTLFSVFENLVSFVIDILLRRKMTGRHELRDLPVYSSQY